MNSKVLMNVIFLATLVPGWVATISSPAQAQTVRYEVAGKFCGRCGASQPDATIGQKCSRCNSTWGYRLDRFIGVEPGANDPLPRQEAESATSPSGVFEVRRSTGDTIAVYEAGHPYPVLELEHARAIRDEMLSNDSIITVDKKGSAKLWDLSPQNFGEFRREISCKHTWACLFAPGLEHIAIILKPNVCYWRNTNSGESVFSRVVPRRHHEFASVIYRKDRSGIRLITMDSGGATRSHQVYKGPITTFASKATESQPASFSVTPD